MNEAKEIVTLKKVTKNYSQGILEVAALRGLDPSVGRGEFTAISGPSGSGKTTTLNLIGALDVPTSGSVIIEGRDLVAQYILLYENSGGEDIEKVVDFNYEKVNVVFELKSSYSRDITHIEKMASGYIEENFTDDQTGHLTGSGDLIVAISHYIIKSQLISLATSIIVVFLMLIFVFRSIRAGLYSIIPLVFTIFTNFTLMKIFGVSLDVATAMIASMGLGIGIDYAIHFVSRYRIEVYRGEKVDNAIKNTMHSTGRAIVFNALAVAFGFLVLTLSNFIPIMNVGWLVAATMIVSASATLIVLPCLISIFGLKEKVSSKIFEGRNIS